MLALNHRLQLQRWVLIVVLSLSLMSNVLFGVVVLRKSERIIVLPGMVSSEFSVGGGDTPFSAKYVEQMTVFFVHLLLDITPQSISYNSSVLLRYVEPGYYQSMVQYFAHEKKVHEKYNLVTRFDITEMKIHGQVVEVYGILTAEFGAGKKQEQEVSYKVDYKIEDGKLLISGFARR